MNKAVRLCWFMLVLQTKLIVSVCYVDFGNKAVCFCYLCVLVNEAVCLCSYGKKNCVFLLFMCFGK